MSNGRVNTFAMLQRRRPFMCLSSHCCFLCTEDGESIDYIFLHCQFTLQLWLKLIKTTGLNWVIPRHCVSLMVERFLGDRLGKKASVL